jgi:hypothetical protein
MQYQHASLPQQCQQQRRAPGPGSNPQRVIVVRQRRCSSRTLGAAASGTPQQQATAPGPAWEMQWPAGPAALGFLDPSQPLSPWIRPAPPSSPPPVVSSGSLRPNPEWFPAWMRYRLREDNYVFWQDKFMRCSLEIPGRSHVHPGA